MEKWPVTQGLRAVTMEIKPLAVLDCTTTHLRPTHSLPFSMGFCPSRHWSALQGLTDAHASKMAKTDLPPVPSLGLRVTLEWETPPRVPQLLPA